MRKCLQCGSGLQVKVFGKAKLIDSGVWHKMENEWERNFGGDAPRLRMPTLPASPAPASVTRPSAQSAGTGTPARIDSTSSAGWFEDPTGRFGLRYRDANGWTSHVSDRQGTTTTDRYPPAPPLSPSTRAAGPERQEATISRKSSDASQDSYAEWVEYCLRLADARKVPRHLVVDLIPAAAQADWTVKPLAEFEELLEQAMPGRRDWLAREGVRSEDFARFWSRPPWVQNFIEALVKRHLQFEVQGHVNNGESEEMAFAMAGVFLPLYSNVPDPPGEFGLHVPFELFDRVENYWSSLDTHAASGHFLESASQNGWRRAADRIRAQIRAGVL